jgi:imidazoleglycerol-phosphate dehydratase
MSPKKSSTSAPKNGVEQRIAKIERNTKETQIAIDVNLDEMIPAKISTTVKFFDHMLELFARHANITLNVQATGDLVHHLVEDVGIALGKVLTDALGDKIGIERYGSAYIPMDETLGFCSVDLSGRPYFVINLQFLGERIEDMACEDLIHFFESLALNANFNLHLKVEYGANDHHKIEAAFKAFAHAFRKASIITSDKILSTKGTL